MVNHSQLYNKIIVNYYKFVLIKQYQYQWQMSIKFGLYHLWIGIRSILIGLLILVVLILIHRQSASHQITIHYPVSPISPYSSLNNSGYSLGDYSVHPKQMISPLEMMRYKKINNYVFVHYNVYKAQLAFVDSGYASVFHFTMFGQDIYFNIQEALGFKLDTYGFAEMNYHFTKKDFIMTVRQRIDEQKKETITTFDIKVKRKQQNLEAHLVHIMRNDECFSATRGNVISHKCYGGYGNGKISLDFIDHSTNKKVINNYNLNNNLTRSVFDGLRGPGTHWNFVWAMGSGFSKQEYYSNNHSISQDSWIGVNFGTLHGEGEDFIFWSGKIIPVKGLSFQFDQNIAEEANITFTATTPPMNLNFTVIKTPKVFKDMGPIKIDMLRLEGYWTGWIDIQGKRNTLAAFAGLVESSDSLF